MWKCKLCLLGTIISMYSAILRKTSLHLANVAIRPLSTHVIWFIEKCTQLELWPQPERCIVYSVHMSQVTKKMFSEFCGCQTKRTNKSCLLVWNRLYNKVPVINTGYYSTVGVHLNGLLADPSFGTWQQVKPLNILFAACNSHQQHGWEKCVPTISWQLLEMPSFIIYSCESIVEFPSICLGRCFCL